jgi:hypothetical protein
MEKGSGSPRARPSIAVVLWQGIVFCNLQTFVDYKTAKSDVKYQKVLFMQCEGRDIDHRHGITITAHP